jgi:hypothetical protein
MDVMGSREFGVISTIINGPAKEICSKHNKLHTLRNVGQHQAALPVKCNSSNMTSPLGYNAISMSVTKRLPSCTAVEICLASNQCERAIFFDGQQSIKLPTRNPLNRLTSGKGALFMSTTTAAAPNNKFQALRKIGAYKIRAP